MNNKQLLIALCITAFSGMTFATSLQTIDLDSNIAVALLTEVQQAYCHEKNTDACKAISAFALLMQDGTIDTTSPELAALLNSLNEEINGKDNNTNILQEAVRVTEEVTEKACTALMVVPQPHVIMPHEQK